MGYGSFLAPPARLELTTLRLGGVRSIQVSYGGMEIILPKEKLCVKGKRTDFPGRRCPGSSGRNGQWKKWCYSGSFSHFPLYRMADLLYNI